MDRIAAHSRKEPSGCWIWTATTDGGHPIIRLRDPRRLYPARRYAYERWNQITLPKNWVVVNRCGVMRCVNPAHAFAVKRGHQAHRQWGLHPPEYCQRGHEWSEWNTGFQKNGGRLCLACDRTRKTTLMARYRKERPQHFKAVRDERAERRREYLGKWKAERGCARCQEMDPACLDFHHRDPAEKDVHIAQVRLLWSLPRLLAELAKCDVLCANCHRKLHAADRVV